MGFMAKIRDTTGVILWILIFAFGVIFMLQDTNVFDTIAAPPDAIAKVNGQFISVQDYQAQVDNQLQNFRQQTNDEIPPQTVEFVQNQVFDALIDDQLRQQEMDRLGLTVTKDEVSELFWGADPHPAIKEYFKGADGTLDRELLTNYVENNPEWTNDVALFLRSERRRQKFENLLAATVRVTDAEVHDEYVRRNERVSVDYVALRYSAVPDSSVTVTDRDLRRYYDEHKDDFEQKRIYSVEYVEKSKLPTAADTADVYKDVNEKKAAFAAATDDSLFLARNYSAKPYSKATFRRDELSPDVADLVFEDLTPGRVVGPIAFDNMMHLVKIEAVVPADNESVKARHILIRAAEGDDAARQAALTQIQDLRRRVLAGEDFAEVASKFSDDRQSALQGGELGWFGPGAMVEPFEKAAFSTPVGRIAGPVETQFGYHLIKVEGRSDKSVEIADYALPIRTLVSTLTSIENDLLDFIEYAKDEGFKQEAERNGLAVQTVQIEEDQENIPQLGNSRKLIDFLARSDEGSISDVIELNDKYIVATITGISPAGVRPFSQVQTEIEPRVKVEKRKAIQHERLAQALQGGTDLAAIASSVGGTVQTASDVTVSNPLVPGLGREPALVGTALGLDDGQMSEVVDGNASSFVVKRTSASALAPMTDAEKETIRQQLVQQRQNALRSQWIQDIRDKADIADNRRKLSQYQYQ